MTHYSLTLAYYFFIKVAGHVYLQSVSFALRILQTTTITIASYFQTELLAISGLRACIHGATCHALYWFELRLFY